MVKTGSRRTRKIASRKIDDSFDLRGATPFGGFNLASDYMTRLGIDRKLLKYFGRWKCKWAVYGMAVILRHVLDGFLLGLGRIYDFEAVEDDPLICAKRGLDKMPDYTLLYKDLERFADLDGIDTLRLIDQGVFRDILAKQCGAVLEVDSTVETLYGSQEGALVGYNPRKPGRPSYHPILCRERKSGFFLRAELRPGDSGSASDAVLFLQRLEPLLPRRGIILTRADKAFASETVMAFHEERPRWGYVLKLKLDRELQVLAYTLSRRRWRRIDDGSEDLVEVASVQIKRQAWSRRRRIVFWRRKNPNNPQGSFWDDLGFNYGAYVTDRDWMEEDVIAFYQQRADIEKAIFDLKDGLGIDKISSEHFLANEAALVLKCMAYNILVRYNHDVLRLARRPLVTTLRRLFLHIPAKLSRSGRRLTLRISELCPWAHEATVFRERIASLA